VKPETTLRFVAVGATAACWASPRDVMPHKKMKMQKQILTLIGIAMILITSCNQKESKQLSDEETWKLGWRMIVSSIDENFELANLQFDTLWNISKSIDMKYLVTGLEAKKEIGKSDEIIEILAVQDKEILQEICIKRFLSEIEICQDYSIEEVDNKALQLELIKMYINDQYVRSNLMTEILDKYNLTKNEVIIDSFGMNTDEKNRERLKEIITECGFPTKKLVGKDAMHGIFLIIQHSDTDKEWQKSQLPNIKKGVDKGDMDSQDYVYLYDRIKINGGEKQLYGTQFAKVDPKTKTVELAPIEDIENLDKRRMEMGMMPIDMYKEFMLKVM